MVIQGMSLGGGVRQRGALDHRDKLTANSNELAPLVCILGKDDVVEL